MSILPDLVFQTADEAYGSIRAVADTDAFLRTYQFDFEAGEFVTDPLKRVRLTEEGKEILLQVVNKTLHDERYRYLVYPDYYGNEIRALIAADYHPDIMENEYKRVIKDALIYHPMVSDVGDFSFTVEKNKMYVSFTVTGTNGIQLSIKEEVII